MNDWLNYYFRVGTSLRRWFGPILFAFVVLFSFLCVRMFCTVHIFFCFYWIRFCLCFCSLTVVNNLETVQDETHSCTLGFSWAVELLVRCCCHISVLTAASNIVSHEYSSETDTSRGSHVMSSFQFAVCLVSIMDILGRLQDCCRTPYWEIPSVFMCLCGWLQMLSVL